jgi:hypothetical protein
VMRSRRKTYNGEAMLWNSVQCYEVILYALIGLLADLENEGLGNKTQSGKTRVVQYSNCNRQRW